MQLFGRNFTSSSKQWDTGGLQPRIHQDLENNKGIEKLICSLGRDFCTAYSSSLSTITLYMHTYQYVYVKTYSCAVSVRGVLMIQNLFTFISNDESLFSTQISFRRQLFKYERMVYFCLLQRYAYSEGGNSFSRTTEQQQRFHEICSNLVKTRRRTVGWWKRLFTLKEEKPKMVLFLF